MENFEYNFLLNFASGAESIPFNIVGNTENASMQKLVQQGYFVKVADCTIYSAPLHQGRRGSIRSPAKRSPITHLFRWVATPSGVEFLKNLRTLSDV